MTQLAQTIATSATAAATAAAIDGLLDSLQGASDAEQDWRLLQFQLRNRDKRLSDESLAELIFAAAVPHWFDAEILSALLDIDMEPARRRDGLLRDLTVVEPAVAMPTASSLHDATRELVLRRLAQQAPEHLSRLAERAHRHFKARRDEDRALRPRMAKAPVTLRTKFQARGRALEIETLYHALLLDPGRGWPEFEAIARRYLRDLDFGGLNAQIGVGEEIQTLFGLDAIGESALAATRALADLGDTARRWGERSTGIGLAQEVESFREAASSLTDPVAVNPLRVVESLPEPLAQAAERAQQAILDGRPRDGIAALDEALGLADTDTLNPSPAARAGLLMLRGNACLAARDYPKAERDFSTVLKIQDRRVEPWIKRSEARRLRGAYREALDDASRAVRLSGDNALALTARGEAYLRMGHLQAAAHDLERAIELARGGQVKARALGARAEVQRRQGHFTAALTTYDEAAALRGEAAWLLAGKGETYRQRAYAKCQQHARGDGGESEPLDGCVADYWSGIEALTKAIDLDPEDAWTRASRGESYRLIAETLEKYRADAEDESAVARYRDLAMTDLDAAIRLRPDYAWARLCRGALLKKLGQLAAARADFDTICAQEPDNARWLAGRGDVHRLAGDYERALPDFDKAALLDGSNGWVLARRGYVHRFLGNYRQAIEDFERARAVDRALAVERRPWVELFLPETVLQWTRFAPELAAEQRIDLLRQARTGLDELAERLAEPAAAHFDRAQVRCLQGRLSEGLGFLDAGRERLRRPVTDRPADLDPASASLRLEYQRLFFLGRVELALGLSDDAQRHFARARSRWDDASAGDRHSALSHGLWDALLQYAQGQPASALDLLRTQAAAARGPGDRTLLRETLAEARMLESVADRDPGRLAALQEMISGLAAPN